MKILMIGAHQDDNEFRCGGLASKYAKMGYDVRFLSLCNGCGGHHVMTPEETTARRAGESAKVAEFLGIKTIFYVMQRYVQPLLDKGKLAMTIPDHPSSKKQQFYSVE